MEINFRIAVKAFVVKDSKLLVLKRRSNDVHKPGAWDIPGGRLEIGEDPLEGVRREAIEEAGLAITPLIPINVHHFTRDDGQLITMIIFLCETDTLEPQLSEEHQEYQWLDLNGPLEQFPDWLHPVIANHRKYIKSYR